MFPVITCHLRYEIDPSQTAAFKKYATGWIPVVTIGLRAPGPEVPQLADLRSGELSDRPPAEHRCQPVDRTSLIIRWFPAASQPITAFGFAAHRAVYLARYE
jgi:hypothetical protein